MTRQATMTPQPGDINIDDQADHTEDDEFDQDVAYLRLPIDPSEPMASWLAII